MNITDIIGHRLVNQQIATSAFTKPEEIVAWMGAMQAQEYAMAKWAIGLRVNGVNDGDVEAAFNNGTILRTHILRPTWHFILPADIRWMLGLSAPRVLAFSAGYYRRQELDKKLLKRCIDTLIKALEGGRQLTRDVLKQELARKKIVLDGNRMGLLMMYAELEGIICSGGRHGKQFTYALLDERVPQKISIGREEALEQLTRRYFTSRSPATAADFVWWSGLTMKDAKAGIAMLGKDFVHEVLDGKEYTFLPIGSVNMKQLQSTFLLPDYDEYGISYKDRSAISYSEPNNILSRGGNPIFNHMVVVNGRIAGTWKRTMKKDYVLVEASTFKQMSKRSEQAVKMAVKKYSAFANCT